MIIPKNIKIGGKRYNVEICGSPFFGKNHVGQIIYHRNKITIKKTNDKRDLEDWFFHEVAHGIIKELEFNHPKLLGFRNNEEFIEEFGLTLRAFFIDLLEKQKGGNIDKTNKK